ncbi:MAG: hypothetical protein M1142_04050 [Patescibacteria group bacterium]|nr:hypothetical protein [Patescibacteria group bacterium]
MDDKKSLGFAPIIVVILLSLVLFGGAFVAKYYFPQPSINNQVQPLATEGEVVPTTKPIQTNQNLDKELVPTPTPTPLPTATPTPTPKPAAETSTTDTSDSKLSLTAVSTEPGKVSMTWTLDGSAVDGFKEVWADHTNPTYPEDHWNYDADTSLRSYTWSNLSSGQTLHFQVGVYKSGQGVVAYSNDVTVTVK